MGANVQPQVKINELLDIKNRAKLNVSQIDDILEGISDDEVNPNDLSDIEQVQNDDPDMTGLNIALQLQKKSSRDERVIASIKDNFNQLKQQFKQ